MSTRVIVDTGPIVALLNRRDQHHEWTRETLDRVEGPLQTCEAVLSEASFLLRALPNGAASLLALVERGVISIEFRLGPEVGAVRALLSRYASVPMSLADACLVRMSELHPQSAVLTLDSDFALYRKNGRQPIPRVSPSQ